MLILLEPGIFYCYALYLLLRHSSPSGLRPLLLQLKKKVRVRKAADEEGAGLDLAALEAEAAAAGKSELGSRKDIAGRAAQAQKAQIADEAQRQSK